MSAVAVIILILCFICWLTDDSEAYLEMIRKDKKEYEEFIESSKELYRCLAPNYQWDEVDSFILKKNAKFKEFQIKDPNEHHVQKILRKRREIMKIRKENMTNWEIVNGS